MKTVEIDSDLKIKLSISKKVFQPTSTTNILLKSCFKIIKKPGKILDLGCGCGVVGFSLFKKNKTTSPLYFSDLSISAIKDVNINAKFHKTKVISKQGSLFDPWENIKFDYIINDVAGISEEVAKISSWYKFVSCESGKNGTKLVNRIIKDSKKYLKKNGSLFIPLISLSNEEMIKNQMSKYYKKIKLIDFIDWPLPKDMYQHIDLLYKLKKQKKINFEEKWGIIICRTSVYMLK